MGCLTRVDPCLAGAAIIFVTFKPQAVYDLVDAVEWYEARRTGLGVELITAVTSALEFVQSFPESCPIVHRDFRQMLTRRFPYRILFRVETDKLVVYAVLHQRRRFRRLLRTR